MRVICSRKTIAKLAFLTVKIIDDFEKIQKKSETKQERFQEIGLFFLTTCHHLRFVSNRYP
jgi:3-deoxy-D-manno-octulosonic-acid transferase